MRKIPFIEKRENLAPHLSKLFNIVVNYKGLNNPRKVGYCTQIYTAYFRQNDVHNFDDAVNFYLNYNERLKGLVSENQRLTGIYALELLKEIDDYLINGNSIIINSSSVKGNNQFRSYSHKVVAIFWKTDLKTTNQKIQSWRNKITESPELISELGSKYLFNLLTIESMIGTSIENDILRTLGLIYNVEKTLSDEKLGIDARVNDLRISVKSVQYKHSPYRATAKQNILKNLQGGIILYYIIKDDCYVVENAEELHVLLKVTC